MGAAGGDSGAEITPQIRPRTHQEHVKIANLKVKCSYEVQRVFFGPGFIDIAAFVIQRRIVFYLIFAKLFTINTF